MMLKKKLRKKKKKRLKEEVSLWEESRRCSDGQDNEPEAVEPPLKNNATDNGKISKKGTGMWVWTRSCIHTKRTCSEECVILFTCQHRTYNIALYRYHLRNTRYILSMPDLI